MRLKDLLQGAGYALPPDMSDREITGVTANSELVRKGTVFVALRGFRVDGFDYLERAFAKGAALAICERRAEGFPHLVVENARGALARLLNVWYEYPTKNMRLIGITGTNGKTSTAAMLYAILRRAGHRCGLIGTVCCELEGRELRFSNDDRLSNMTTPDPAQLYALLAQMRDGGATHVVMEVTSHALALSKVEPLVFERAVFTNLSPDHLDLHGDMESYFAEKRKLFAQTRGAVVSCLSPYGRRLADGLMLPLRRLEASDIGQVKRRGAEGSDFELMDGACAKMAISIPVAGDFSIENAALAALTARSLGVEADTVTAALRDFQGVRGRMERVREDSDIAVFLDYAHTPDALERLLRTVRGFRTPRQQILLLFGCGGDRDRSKRAEMGRIASRLADTVILTSDNSRSERPEDIINDILKGIDKERPYLVVPDRRKAIAAAVDMAQSGDILLLAGKGHEDYEICGEQRLPFCEREIVRDCLKRRRKKRHADRTV
ncbi:MAG: UDP-N-acetylmuramoyl-L-alanyl-D-glutamate--2,6-diaminopimelate ligase [Clostridia bacterium]|nr:UDP-N-acetylmuramoyl-L-alanyl-D-glutamate--2,6-diaminopimelate ligase [Clostridia bacterium]